MYVYTMDKMFGEMIFLTNVSYPLSFETVNLFRTPNIHYAKCFMPPEYVLYPVKIHPAGNAGLKRKLPISPNNDSLFHDHISRCTSTSTLNRKTVENIGMSCTTFYVQEEISKIYPKRLFFSTTTFTGWALLLSLTFKL